MTLLQDQASKLWIVRKDGEFYECVAKLLGNRHVEVQILSNSTEIYAQSFPSGDEALAWADEERQRLTTRTSTPET